MMDEFHKAADFQTDLNQKSEVGVDNVLKCNMCIMVELDALHGAMRFFTHRLP